MARRPIMRANGHAQPWGHCRSLTRDDRGNTRAAAHGGGTGAREHRRAGVGSRRQTVAHDAYPRRRQRHCSPTGNTSPGTRSGRTQRADYTAAHWRGVLWVARGRVARPSGRHVCGRAHVVERHDDRSVRHPDPDARTAPTRPNTGPRGRHGADRRERIRPHQARCTERPSGDRP